MGKLQELTVECPFVIYLPRKTKEDKRYPLNLNHFRNAHFQENNKAKVLFSEIVKEQLQGKVLEVPVNVSYKVYKPTARRLDKMNVASVVSKFLLDSMSEYGVIPDDNDDYVKDEHLYDSVKDKENPRVVVMFKTVEEI